MFALTLLASAALSFLVQPLIARQLLPLAGGSPAVWNTCLIFFQTTLLAGYRYAHWLQRFPIRTQSLIHLSFVILAGLSPLVTGLLAPEPSIADSLETAPVAILFFELIKLVGLPSFVLSSTAPLLQAWFCRPRTGSDTQTLPNPFPLYAASNVGSLLGLLSYPFAIEPALTLGLQRRLWCLGFGIVALGILLCNAITLKRTVTANPKDDATTLVPISRSRFLKWLALSALTVSLLASVTAHLSTDIAPMPLLWVVPLSIYLLTYIITFAKWTVKARRFFAHVGPMTICFVAVALLAQATEPMILVAAIHLLGLLVLGLLCHGELAADQPDPRHVTNFYFALASGGVLGGTFNAVIAPRLFAHLGPVEYPLVLVLISLVRPMQPILPLKRSDYLWPVAVAIVALVALISVPHVLPAPAQDDEAGKMIDRLVRGGLTFGIPVAFCFALVWRPGRFALCMLAILSIGFLARFQGGGTLLVSRNFYGTLRVSEKDEFIIITHGTTNHGMQRKGDGPPEPAMYYHRNGPVGRVWKAKPGKTVGVVGLGCGAMAAYAEKGEKWTFFEIDPGVVEIARNENYFTFLKNSRADSMEVVLGDARRKLANVPDGSFDILAIDAFSSDAVPVHLLTKEAFALYFRKLKPNGRLLLHLSNRYLDLPSLAARVIRDLDPALVIKLDEDTLVTEKDRASGKMASTWMIATKDIADLGELPYFAPMVPKPGPIWTDDFTPLKGVWKWEEE